jgi:hypothetical protein
VISCNQLVYYKRQWSVSRLKLPFFSFAIWNADDKGFICQQCGLVRDKDEIRKIASEVKSMSEKALISSSSGSILLDCLC